VAVQSNLNGILLACGIISSRMVMNEEKGIVGRVAVGIDLVGQHIPTPVAGIALDAISKLLSTYDQSIQRKRVDKVVGIFRNDAVLISQVTEKVARELTNINRYDLMVVDNGDQKASSASIIERMRNAYERWKSSKVMSTSKEMAQRHVESIVSAIMQGEINERFGDFRSISDAIINHYLSCKTIDGEQEFCV